MRKITYKLIAQKAGLSIMSVSNALRNPEEVRPVTRDKVHKAISDLGGEVNHPLQTASKFVVAHRPHRRLRFVTANIGPAVRESPVYGRVFQGAVEEAGKQGFEISFINLDQPKILSSSSLDENVDVLILLGRNIACPIKPKVPVITLMSSTFPYISDHVGYNRSAVGELIADRFYEQGIRSAIYFGPDDLDRGRAFINRYKQLDSTVKAHAFFVDVPYKINQGRLEIDYEGVESMAMEITKKPIEGVFGYSDELIAILRHILVDKDNDWTKTTWAGCNNDPQFVKLLGRNAFSIEIHAMEIGRLAVRRAVEIARSPGQPKRQILLEPYLVSSG